MNTLKNDEIGLETGRPKIAVPITSAYPDEIIKECENIGKLPCQMIEWRADKYLAAIEDLDSAVEQKDFYLDMMKILDDMNYIADGTPIIFTIRSKAQGGDVTLDRMTAADITGLAAKSGLVNFVDIELMDDNGFIDETFLREQIEEIHGYGCSVIISHHDFDSMPTPQKIVETVGKMMELGGDVYKFAAMANSKKDAETLLKTTAFLNKNKIGPIIMIAMGDEGMATRVAAGRYGSCVTFASAGKASAPGQVDVFTLAKWLDDYYG